ncbi:uncharacterized protein LOC106011305 [Aplysia californica]|uniref:Uncharacterized protein LOC106011305 n=1 Tax=Aplysia californica TaxID=6500 RepID=A0ABM1VQQ0_APLCA|nr:uncharacterized protein LOC106011305 [Aplysia californica]
MAGRPQADELYLKESQKSYQKCQVANSARRNSLMKKTIGIEAERKLAKSQMGREEKQLREHLRAMKIEQSKTSLTNGIRGKNVLLSLTCIRFSETTYLRINSHINMIYKCSINTDKTSRGSGQATTAPGVSCDVRQEECIDPYPVTFCGKSLVPGRQRSMTVSEKGRSFEKAGARYAMRRDRRVSKEFEDLNMNTSTGKLAIPPHLLLRPGSRSSRSSKSSNSSGAPSPSTPRRGAGGGSHPSLDTTSSDPAPTWQGSPEAIRSVRRPRKSVEQQEREKVVKLIHELDG